MDLTLEMIKNFMNIRYEDLPATAIEAVKKEVVDSLATAVGGSSKPGVGELVAMAKEWGGSPQSTVIAYGIKCPAPNAAQVNGTMIHALDYDDGHPDAVVHVGCVAVSTCFAAAERMGGISGREFITTMALGADFLSRLGLASGTKSSAHAHGWHPTATLGILGAALMAGKIMKLDQDKMVNALGLAYHQCGGAGSGVGDGALAKRIGPGLASKAGITAAIMAEKGITGERNPINGKNGLFTVYLQGDCDPDKLMADLGKRFEGINVTNKPYPCCGFTHPFIDAALALRSKHNIQADQIQKITVIAGQPGYALCEPLDVKRNPRTIVDAQFSVPWTVSAALVQGKVTVGDFTDSNIKRENILKLTEKVTPKFEDSMSRHGVGPGIVSILMNDGTEHTEEVIHSLGSVEKPMNFEDCAAKFRECAPSSIKPLSSETIEHTIDLIKNLEKLDDATSVIRLLG